MKKVSVLVLSFVMALFLNSEVAQAAKYDGHVMNTKMYQGIINSKLFEENWLKEDLCHIDGIFPHGGWSEMAIQQTAEMTLGKQYPGSSFSCMDGNGVILKGNTKYYFSDWNLYRKEINYGSYQQEINFNLPEIIKVISGNYYVVFTIIPGAAVVFQDVQLPTIASEAEAIIKENRAINFSSNKLIDAVNDLYNTILYRKMNVFEFAKLLVLSNKDRKTVIEMIQKMYTTGLKEEIEKLEKEELEKQEPKVDGYTKTAQLYKGSVKGVMYDLNKVIQNICPPHIDKDIDKAQRQIDSLFPDSAFSCKDGTGFLKGGKNRIHIKNWNVVKFEDRVYAGGEYWEEDTLDQNKVKIIRKEYTSQIKKIGRNLVHVKNVEDRDYIVFSVDTENPHQSKFLDAYLPDLVSKVKKNLGENLPDFNNILIGVINDLYREEVQHEDKNNDMFYFVYSVVCQYCYPKDYKPAIIKRLTQKIQKRQEQEKK